MRRLSFNGIAFLCAVVYAGNALHYGWSPFIRTTRDDILEWVTVVALLALYWAGYRRLREGRTESFRNVILPAIPLVAIAFLTMPYDSTDVFVYMDAGWLQAHYGMNPYIHVLDDIPGTDNDRMIRSDWMQMNKNLWRDLPLAYGFLFALLARALDWLGNGHWWLTLALFKGINVVAYAICARLVWSLSKGLGQLRPDLALYLFAWSPLILQHHIANAHNDLLVGSLIAAAAFFHSRKRLARWAPATLVAAAMIKYVTLPLVPLSLWLIARQNGRREVSLAGLFSSLVLLFSLPYLHNLGSYRIDLISSQVSKLTSGSFAAFLFYVFRTVVRLAGPASLETFGFLLKMLLWSIGAGVVAAEAYRFCRKRQPSLDDWIATSSRILFAIIFIASSQFYSWYIGMFLPLTLMLRSEDWLRSFSILLSGAHVFSLTSLSRKGIGYFLLTLFPAIMRR